MIKKTLQTALLLYLLSYPAVAAADDLHYNNILIGDRASGMGGAYTAVSDDPGGLYFNPAGIAYSTGQSLSASVNAYSVTNRTYKGVFGGQDWKRTSSTLLPNFFGIIQPIGKFKFGFSYAVPDSSQEDQDQQFTRADYGGASETINFNNKNDTTLFGPSIALQLNEKFSIGTSLYAHKRSTEAVLYDTIISGDASQYLLSSAYSESDEWGIRPVVGIMWAPVDKLSLGLTFAKTLVLDSEIIKQSTLSSNTTSQAIKTFETYSDKRSYPYQITAGAAFFPTSTLLISCDLSFNSAYEYTLANVLNKRDAVINGAVGAEYYLNKNWAVRGGLFTDFSNAPKIVNDTSTQFEHIDLFGSSMTLSHFTKNTSLTFGGNYKFGSGESKVAGGSKGIQDVTANGWILFVSSSYSY